MLIGWLPYGSGGILKWFAPSIIIVFTVFI